MKTQKGTCSSSFLGARGGPFMLNKFKLDSFCMSIVREPQL